MNDNQNVDDSNKKNIFVYLVVGYLALTYWILFDSAFAGIRLTKGSDIGSGLITNAIAYWYVWKKLGKNPIIGILTGVVVFLLLTFAAAVIAAKSMAS